jgi:DNA-binding response OmpR family regulator
MKKVLIIEDDIILSATLADNINHKGFETLHARDGEEGLDMALIIKPDLILLDILLPKMDGLTMLRKLRKDPWGKDVPVIILSNLNMPKNGVAGIGGDVSEYLVKVDWKIEDVMTKIENVIKNKGTSKVTV